jgi:hypothetical protein
MVEMHSECPPAFHWLAIAAVVGNAVGFNTWAKLDKGVLVYPNINALLLGPAGRCRRGEGTKYAIKVARYAGLRVHEGKATPEGIADALVEDENLIFYVEEMSNAISKREHQRALVPFLTKALLNSGCPLDERTRGQGVINIPRANLSALFTSAPDWFLDTMPEEAYGGGLMSRFLTCYLPDRELIHTDPNAEGDDDKVFSELASGLNDIRASMPKGHLKLTPDAASWWRAWYDKNERVEVIDPRMDPHRNRAPANALRVATLLTITTGGGIIDKPTIEQAVQIVEWYMPTIWAMYGYTDTMGSAVGRLERRVVWELQRAGGEMLHRDLMIKVSSFVGRGGDSKAGLMMMVEKGIIEMIQKVGMPASWYPPSLGWRLVRDEG